jgi:hypothetical protein
MAVSSITIVQDNKVGNCDLLAVHNPLVFLIDVVYTSTVPDALFCELQDSDSNVLNTFSAIPYEDSSTESKRTYAFIASNVLKAYMDDFEDFETDEGTLDFVENITKQFVLRFYIDSIETSIAFTAIHAARQFGELPALTEIYNNNNERYYTGKNNPVYIYIYNSDENNNISIGAPTSDDLYALDYDDVVFVDSDDSRFKIL